MNIIDLRKNLQQSPVAKRISDRRKVPYPFGSPEWLEYMQQNNLEIPKTDRRKLTRRTEDKQRDIEQPNSEKKYARVFLTAAEKKLLADLYLIDLE